MSRIIYILLAIILVSACKNASDTKTIRLAHGLDVSHPVHKAMFKMGEDVETLSDGTLKMEIYPNQQLGTEREVVELLQIGSLDMTKVSGATLENFAPKIAVLGLPYLFRDRDHAFSVFDGPIGQELLDDAQQYWLKGLCFYDAGSRSFYTKDKSVEHPNDLKGKKIRVMESVTAMNMVSSMGGAPTPISWGELYTALQQGVVDGAENNPPSFYLSRHYEVCKYYSLNEHTFTPDILIASTHFWNTLSEEEQGWMKMAIENSVSYQRKLWAEAEAEALAAVEKAGVTVTRPSKEAFSKTTVNMLEELRDNEELYALIQRIKAE
ncbi:TRAP transporter substrate-binding protein [Flagellimonas nanhaiensis]|uniref:TRAP transporter substrate-binding protein n=1 Tax=Flagellimonas nanhaiensis TaxID=2292706 RepID=A0A371JPD5_9FLAO|nr:TRAP transporter substrate-binding protein [Allomuricauda nanhaiensis]RDY59303.1 TRAP transporter substrate-binding protein [Allomuricauda nanhaiensis]